MYNIRSQKYNEQLWRTLYIAQYQQRVCRLFAFQLLLLLLFANTGCTVKFVAFCVAVHVVLVGFSSYIVYIYSVSPRVCTDSIHIIANIFLGVSLIVSYQNITHNYHRPVNTRCVSLWLQVRCYEIE